MSVLLGERCGEWTAEEPRRSEVKVGLLYPLWRSFSTRGIDSAMPVVGRDLARWLAVRGVDVRVYSEGERTRWTSYRSEGVDYRGVPRALDAGARRLLLATTALEKTTGRWSIRKPASLLEYVSYSALAAWNMRRHDMDVAHISIFDQLIPVVRRLSPETAIVFHMHDHKQTMRDERVVRRRLSQADVIVGCSEFVTNRVRERFPELADRCRTVLNAVDERFFEASLPEGRLERRAKRVLFLGRVSPEKGVHTLLEAFQDVGERHPEVELEIWGPSSIPAFREVAVMKDERIAEQLVPFYEDDARYSRHLRSLLTPAIRDRVHFRGAIPHGQVQRVLRQTDIVVFAPIWHEPFGLPVIEALASGKPLITTPVGGIPEIVEDRKTALFVEPASPNELAAAVSELLDNPDLGQRLGLAGREHAMRHFSWSTRVDDWLRTYAAARAKHRHPPAVLRERFRPSVRAG